MSQDKADKRRRCIQTIAGWLRILIAEDQVTELRALGVQRRSERPHVESGFFDAQHLKEMAEIAFDLTSSATGVYFVMNPLKSEILARRANRVDYAHENELAKDTDVLQRRWLLIDVDPKRLKGISSTDAEKFVALEVIRNVRTDLAGQGWPAPILGDSGNGFHLFYRIDLPAGDSGIVERILKALAAKYDSPQVTIDQSVFNPSRICKLPGTMARKGDDVKERPHRWAKFLEVPKS
jgi:hypothetical protein